MRKKLAIHGGKPVTKIKFPASHHFGDDDIAAITKVLKKANSHGSKPIEILQRGTERHKFERNFSNLHDSKYGILVNSGTSAINSIYGAINPDPGTEVICTPWTSIGSVSGAIFHGMVPVFADIDETLCIDPIDVESKITNKTRAIVAVHMFGNPCDMNKLIQIAEKYNLFLIEDCTQAHFSKYQNKLVGSIGDIAAWGLSEHQHFTGAGNCGILVTNNTKLYERAFGYSDQALNRADGPFKNYPYVHNFLAQNYNANELAASILNVQFSKAIKNIEKKINHAKNILKQISEIPELIPQKVRNGDKHTYWNMSLILKKNVFNCDANKFAESIVAEGIPFSGPYLGTGKYPLGPINKHPIFTNLDAFGKSKYPFDYKRTRAVDYKLSKCSNGEDLMSRTINFSPLSTLTEENVENTIEAIKKVANFYKK
ncbi:MAG: hypothetical protein FI687_02880 [SAR202 cluster bacterium]|nr:hypothetical protein [SAR202 cluster bacterium]|tara:strand:- start:25594 stop:26877 length:1284 start_codon:yes stop_codon:yes gene_type:complete